MMMWLTGGKYLLVLLKFQIIAFCMKPKWGDSVGYFQMCSSLIICPKKGLVLENLLIERIFFNAAATAVVVIVFVTRTCSAFQFSYFILNDELSAECFQTAMPI